MGRIELTIAPLSIVCSNRWTTRSLTLLLLWWLLLCDLPHITNHLPLYHIIIINWKDFITIMILTPPLFHLITSIERSSRCYVMWPLIPPIRSLKVGKQGEIEESFFIKKKGDILFNISPVNLQVHRLCDNFDYYISLKLSLNLYIYPIQLKDFVSTSRIIVMGD